MGTDKGQIFTPSSGKLMLHRDKSLLGMAQDDPSPHHLPALVSLTTALAVCKVSPELSFVT